MRFVKPPFVLGAWLLAGLGFSEGRAAAQLPADLGRSEVRCNDSSCAIGGCILHELLDDNTRLVRSARVVPAMLDGHPHGFKLFAIRQGSIPQRLGLQNGDTLLGVNGHDLGDPTAALNAFTSLRDAKEAAVVIERSGKPIARTYYFDRRPLKAGDCPPASADPSSATTQGPTAATKPTAKPAGPTADARAMMKDISCAGKRCKLKNGVVSRLLGQTGIVDDKVRVVPFIKDGQTVGLKLFSIEPDSLLYKLLLRNGDLVRKVGDTELKNAEAALEAYSKMIHETLIPVEIERAGQTITLTYEIVR